MPIAAQKKRYVVVPSVPLVIAFSAVVALQQPANAEERTPTSEGGSRYSCEYFDKFNNRAQQVLTPQTNCESVFGDIGGLKSDLADHGIGVQMSWSPKALYDVKGQDRKPQEYGGQNPTWSHSLALVLTYDLARVGFTDGAQLTFSPQWQTSNYQAGYPNLGNVAVLAVNQPLYGGRIELQYGYYPMIRQFYGMVLGGNSASAALGPTSVIPVQVGLSLNAPTPAFDVTFRDKSLRWYNHTAITRSVTSDGLAADVKRNPYGLKLHVDGANPLIANEFGYKVKSGPNQFAQWFRAGVIYNTSNYSRFDEEGKTGNNYGAYVANTRQLTQPVFGAPQGLYLDTKVNWAPKDRNAYNGDFQVTLFDIGLFPGRPRDMTSLGFTKSFISSDFREYLGNRGQEAAQSVSALSLSHAMRVSKGIYWINGITYQDNPTLAPKRGDAFLLQTSFNFNF